MTESIRVGVRMRPMNSRESSEGHYSIWNSLKDFNCITQTSPDGNPLPEKVQGQSFFNFDQVFTEESSTQEVYEAVGSDIVQSVFIV